LEGVGALDKVSTLSAIDTLHVLTSICTQCNIQSFGFVLHQLTLSIKPNSTIYREEMVRRYPDVMVGMGASRDLGQTGPDDAGDALTKTTIKVHLQINTFVTSDSAGSSLFN
jgi:hypothetical protein